MTPVLVYLKLMRPLNLFQGSIAVLVCAAIMPHFPEGWKIGLAIAVAVCFTGGGNAINDYFDYAVDKINRPYRPIPSGRIRRKNALIFAVALFGIGLLFSVPILNFRTGIIIGLALFLLVSYSPWFKSLPFWGNFVVSVILGMTFLFSAAVFGNVMVGIPPALLAFGFNLIRELVKDMQDVKGDKIINASTIPLKYGLNVARRIVLGLTLLLMGGAFLPYLLNIYSQYYLWVLIFTVEIPLLFVIFLTLRDTSVRNCTFVSRLLKIDVFFGLLAIFAGKF